MPDRDLFAQVPLRLCDALRRHEITIEEFGLVAFLAGECFRSGGTATYTVRGLMEAVGYQRSDDTLRRSLHRLRDDGWIEFDVAERQRTPLVFSLTGAGVRPKPDRPPEEADYRKAAASEDAFVRQSQEAGRQSVQQFREVEGIDLSIFEGVFDHDGCGSQSGSESLSCDVLFSLLALRESGPRDLLGARLSQRADERPAIEATARLAPAAARDAQAEHTSTPLPLEENARRARELADGLGRHE
jgi:hypothetical protein